MATQEISQSAFETLCAEVADALASNDFKTASSKYAQAQAVHLGLLNSSISTGADSVTRFASLRDLKEAITFSMTLNDSGDDSRLIRTKTKI